MKRVLFISALLMALTACGGGSDTATQTPAKTPEQPNFQATSLELTLGTQLMIADGESTLFLSSTAFDAAGNSKTNLDSVTYYVDGKALSDREFTTTEAGEYSVYAKVGDVETPNQYVFARDPISVKVVEIPVIFHVGELDSNEFDHVDQAYIDNLIEKLNRGFSNAMSQSDANSVDTGIRFRAATLAPDGSVLKQAGIHRFNAQSYDDGGAHYDQSFNIAGDDKFGTFEVYRLAAEQHWPMDKYKNVYLLPSEDSNWAVSYQLNADSTSTLEGIPSLQDEFEDGSTWTDITLIQGFDSPSDVIVHEMGHAFGLLHPESMDGCLTADYATDTMSLDYQDAEHVCEDDAKGQRYQNAHSLTKFHLDNFMHGYNEWEQNAVSQGYDHFTYDQRERMRLLITEGKYLSDLVKSDR